jgi:MYXO-CTERM domain-containing protein
MRRPFLLALFAATAAVLAAGTAHADCLSDADCPQGLVCQEMGTAGCPPCAIGEPCDDPCTPETISECAPGPCTTDADCGAGLRCLSLTYEQCVAQADCAPDVPCPEPADPVCETTTVSVCAPPYLLPCQSDADCGAGFTCVVSETCACAGSDGTTTPTDDPVPPDCTCEPTGEMACQPVEITCTDDSVCPTGWACATGGDDVPCTYDPQTGQTICEEDPTPSAGQCQPPYWGWAGDAREEGLTAAQAADDLDGRGCQAAPGAAGGGLLGLLLLGALAVRRRRG